MGAMIVMRSRINEIILAIVVINEVGHRLFRWWPIPLRLMRPDDLPTFGEWHDEESDAS